MTILPDTGKDRPEPRGMTARLRGTPLYEGHGEASDLPEQAADTIDALTADRDRLREALREADERLRWAREQIDTLAINSGYSPRAVEQLRGHVDAVLPTITAALEGTGGEVG